jgi:hypothetical protein
MLDRDLIRQIVFHEAGQAAAVYLYNKQKQLPSVDFQITITRTGHLMCQHFSGHIVKQILAAFRSSLATNSYWPNEVVHGCKTPQYIQIYPA